ncbi:MAG TPA: hypothetical protein VN213_16795 [Solirubrobacteraceae bacterium]|nr:hypothetical protein [Solirubrobacteraceae bacterium]
MSVITDVWRQLVQRRLWPVALLLVAALAAVPLFLAQDPEPAPAVPAVPSAGSAGKGVLASAPIVAVATSEDRAKRRKVLGERHDIFKPTAKPVKAAKAKTSGETGTASTPAATPGEQESGGSTGGGATEPAATETPKAEPTPKPVPANSLTVRFGDPEKDSLTVRRLAPNQPVPSSSNPVAIYLGLKRDGKTAVFLVPSGVVPAGDGTCSPDAETCETLELKLGETEFFDVVDAEGAVTKQFQLDLVAAHRVDTADAVVVADADSESTTRLIKARVARAARQGFAWRFGAGAARP